MGFFHFPKRSSVKKVEKVIVHNDEQSITTTGSRGSSTYKLKKSKKTDAPIEKERKSLALRVAERYIGLYRSEPGHEEELRELFHPGSFYTFEDIPPIPTSASVDVLKGLNASFLDIKWEYDEMKEPRPGLVEVSGFRVSGTHNGAPYTFHPNFPAIPAAGKFCQNDEETMTLHINEHGKIEQIQIVALGILTGPAGFYEQIGGKMG
mmetsp:Transcript_2149/g.4692  ORF Transcript_2149/g.4692 Transcript_2149/m.4692 type:complete len:207 (-) Transcript_2149:104-724(-)|eukprot:scaffold8828_cov204-Amphora_coffeaeformis.AAC.6